GRGRRLRAVTAHRPHRIDCVSCSFISPFYLNPDSRQFTRRLRAKTRRRAARVLDTFRDTRPVASVAVWACAACAWFCPALPHCLSCSAPSPCQSFVTRIPLSLKRIQRLLQNFRVTKTRRHAQTIELSLLRLRYFQPDGYRPICAFENAAHLGLQYAPP